MARFELDATPEQRAQLTQYAARLLSTGESHAETKSAASCFSACTKRCAASPAPLPSPWLAALSMDRSNGTNATSGPFDSVHTRALMHLALSSNVRLVWVPSFGSMMRSRILSPWTGLIRRSGRRRCQIQHMMSTSPSASDKKKAVDKIKSSMPKAPNSTAAKTVSLNDLFGNRTRPSAKLDAPVGFSGYIERLVPCAGTAHPADDNHPCWTPGQTRRHLRPTMFAQAHYSSRFLATRSRPWCAWFPCSGPVLRLISCE